MCFRKLKNKDEDIMVENNKGMPHVLLRSCNDQVFPKFHTFISITSFFIIQMFFVYKKKEMKDCDKVRFFFFVKIRLFLSKYL